MSALEVVTARNRRDVDPENLQKGIRMWDTDDTARGPTPPARDPKTCEIVSLRDKPEVTRLQSLQVPGWIRAAGQSMSVVRER